MIIESTKGQFVNTFGQHEVAEFTGRHGQKIIDLVEPQLHEDGEYTLHLSSHFYAASLDSQWFSTAGGVLEFHGDGFLDISNRGDAEKAAEEIADSANREIQEHYVENPDIPIEEVINGEYSGQYGVPAPEFTLKTHGSVQVVEADDLVEYWEENRSED